MVRADPRGAIVGPDCGFTLAELLVATLLTLVAISLAVSLIGPTGAAFQALPDAVDTQQRLRVAAFTLADDIAAAGAGFSLGWGAVAAPAWPAVLPCRWTGDPLGEMPGGCARSDAITVLTMAVAAPQGIVEAPAGVAGAVRIAALSACGLSLAVCRLQPGSRVLLIDGAGRWDIFLATSVSADGAEIAHDDRALSRGVAEGALVGEVSVNAYSLRADTTTGALQLRRGNGGSQDSPVVDRVTALGFEYFAESAPPEVVGTGAGSVRTTTYGPLPPPLDADNPADAWPAGENCVFASDGVTQRPRLAALPPDAHGLTLLPPAALADGPWCPDGASPNRWDADLLRIRLVRVTLRVQAASPAARRAPDQEVRLEIALRNRPR